jgi:hypothetical protein
MEEVINNSFKDFHVKGFDYICVRRSPTQTVKLYFFDGDVSKLPEVVNPHDHRYNFETFCITGSVENLWFDRRGTARSDSYRTYEKFEYRTPLLGGNGFRHAGQAQLALIGRQAINPGESYWMDFNEIHTIRMVESETVIALVQHEDRVREDVPTFTYTRDREPPSLDGLYSKFAADQIVDRLQRLKERVPSLVLPEVV